MVLVLLSMAIIKVALSLQVRVSNNVIEQIFLNQSQFLCPSTDVPTVPGLRRVTEGRDQNKNTFLEQDKNTFLEQEMWEYPLGNKDAEDGPTWAFTQPQIRSLQRHSLTCHEHSHLHLHIRLEAGVRLWRHTLLYLSTAITFFEEFV